MKLCDVHQRYADYARKDAHHIAFYQEHLERYRHLPTRLLELGVWRGGSLLMWQEWFGCQAMVRGVDSSNKQVVPPAVDLVHVGRQEDVALLAAITNKYAPDGWDIVIDDCAHIAQNARASFAALYPRLKSGGLYCIEDWGTGYWAHWPDGAAYTGAIHQAGMVGFVHELLDECAAMDHSKRPSTIRAMHAGLSIVILEKA